METKLTDNSKKKSTRITKDLTKKKIWNLPKT